MRGWIILITFSGEPFALIDDGDPFEFTNYWKLFDEDMPVIYPTESAANEVLMNLDASGRAVALTGIV